MSAVSANFSTPCDCVTIGESMVLMQPFAGGPLAQAPLLARSVGGAESNVAIGLSRLGKKSRWISRLGRDPFGDIVLSTLAGEGVDVSLVARDDTAPTAVFFKESKGYGEPHVYYYRRGSAASGLSPQHIKPSWFEGARHLHVTGITPALGADTAQAIEQAMRAARERGLAVSFDPNLRRKLWDESRARATLLPLIALCDVFLPGLEEAEFLIGARPATDYGAEFLDMGPRVVALKLGARGALGFTRAPGGNASSNALSEIKQGENGQASGNCTVEAPPYEVPHIVDVIGAGDAFAAGFLSVWLDETATQNVQHSATLTSPALQRALTRANLMGALATQFRGDWEGLPTLAELERIEAGQSTVTR